MATGLRAFGLVVAVVIVASISGTTEMVAPLLLLGLLVGILALALRPTRPSWRGQRRGKAHRLGYLARYSSPGDWAEDVLSALALSAIIDYAGVDDLSAWMTTAVVAAVGFTLQPKVVGAALGASGTVVTLLGLFVGTASCPPALDGAGARMFVAVAVVALAVSGVVALRLLPVPGRLPLRRMRVQSRALLVFGLLDIVAFVVAPGDESIWQSAPSGAQLGTLALVGVVVFLGAFGPRAVLGLTALGAGIGEIYLVVVGSSTSSSTSGCEPGTNTLIAVVTFVLVAGVGSTLRRRPGQ